MLFSGKDLLDNVSNINYQFLNFTDFMHLFFWEKGGIMRLLQCESLQASDIYFDKILTSSSNLNLLGDIELNDEELKHLTKLISKELRKINSTIKDSLSIAVFLVWMGILHYRDNFWTPVYRALELPDNQVKWQRILGETFIQTVKKYKFPIFEGKQRYVTPILAHGYVPNYFLNSYFSDVVMALYIRAQKSKSL